MAIQWASEQSAAGLRFNYCKPRLVLNFQVSWSTLEKAHTWLQVRDGNVINFCCISFGENLEGHFLGDNASNYFEEMV